MMVFLPGLPFLRPRLRLREYWFGSTEYLFGSTGFPAAKEVLHDVPTDSKTINDLKATSLYSITTFITVRQFRFLPTIAMMDENRLPIKRLTPTVYGSLET